MVTKAQGEKYIFVLKRLICEGCRHGNFPWKSYLVHGDILCEYLHIAMSQQNTCCYAISTLVWLLSVGYF